MTDEQAGIFGIDLGTTYSVVAYIDDTGRPAVTRNNYGEDTTPSVVYFEDESSTVVGKAAKEAAAQAPDNVVSLIKREMGNKDYVRRFFGNEYTPPAIAAIILSALGETAEVDANRKMEKVVITVPAYFGLLEKDATRKAGEIAGLDVIGIVPEPVAAAIEYGITGSSSGTTVLVYDLGGGTFDVSIMRLTEDKVEVLVTDGSRRLGGADWDTQLLTFIVDEAVMQMGDETLRDDESELQNLRSLAERTKRDLSSVNSKSLQVRYTGSPAKVVVTREQFEGMTRDLLEETLMITERSLVEGERKYPGLRDSIDDVLLVGGSSWMPAVAESLRKRFGWEPKLADPDLAVAKGAALYAAGRTVQILQEQTLATAEGGTTVSPEEAQAEAVESVASEFGIAPGRLAQTVRETVNVLPRALGVKLIDTTHPNHKEDTEGASYVHHILDANTQLSTTADPFTARTIWDNQDSVRIELYEQAGAVKSRDLVDNLSIDHGEQLITGLPPLPAGSPIVIELSVDNEGTASVHAYEPSSGRDLVFSVRISILSQDQVDEAKAIHSGLSINS